MNELIYFAIFGGAFFLMMRYGCGAHVMGHGHGKKHGHSEEGKKPNTEVHWIPPATDSDPVCGKTVRPDDAKSSLYKGNVFYFCSRDCREQFEDAPERYLKKGLRSSLPTRETTNA